MGLHNISNLPSPQKPFASFAEVDDYFKRFRRSLMSWIATLPEHIDIVTMGITGLADPNDDRIVFWDDSAGSLKWLDIGASLAITTTTLDAIQDIRTTAGPSFDHLHLTVAIGTSPFTITSTTMSANLNADLLDGYHASAFLGLPALTDPDDDRIVFWDDSEGALKWLDLGNSLSITLAVLDTIQDIRTTAGPTFDHLHLPTRAEDATCGIYEGTIGLIRSFTPNGTLANIFIGDSGNNTMGNGGVGLSYLGTANIAIGDEALNSLTQGYYNLAIGPYALYTSTLGLHNVAIGDHALYSSLSGAGCVAIGYNAGYWETGSDKLFIDNAARTNEADGRAKALVYGIFDSLTDNQYFTVNGHLTGLHTVRAGENDVVRGILYAYGPATGGAYGGTLLAYTGADHDTTIQNYGFMVVEDDLQIGPDTNVDALKLDALDDLYITGGSLILPASEYVNFGGTQGSGGYGLRDNAGDIEYCDSGGAWTALNAGGGGGAPTDATYIVQTANGSLSAEQALSALATGVLQVTTGTGVLNTATPGAHIADASGGTVIDTEARAAINAVIAALETHVLLASS
jgi:hypothetical protein